MAGRRVRGSNLCRYRVEEFWSIRNYREPAHTSAKPDPNPNSNSNLDRYLNSDGNSEAKHYPHTDANAYPDHHSIAQTDQYTGSDGNLLTSDMQLQTGWSVKSSLFDLAAEQQPRFGRLIAHLIAAAPD